MMPYACVRLANQYSFVMETDETVVICPRVREEERSLHDYLCSEDFTNDFRYFLKVALEEKAGLAETRQAVVDFFRGDTEDGYDFTGKVEELTEESLLNKEAKSYLEEIRWMRNVLIRWVTDAKKGKCERLPYELFRLLKGKGEWVGNIARFLGMDIPQEILEEMRRLWIEEKDHFINPRVWWAIYFKEVVPNLSKTELFRELAKAREESNDSFDGMADLGWLTEEEKGIVDVQHIDEIHSFRPKTTGQTYVQSYPKTYPSGDMVRDANGRLVFSKAIIDVVDMTVDGESWYSLYQDVQRRIKSVRDDAKEMGIPLNSIKEYIDPLYEERRELTRLHSDVKAALREGRVGKLSGPKRHLTAYMDFRDKDVRVRVLSPEDEYDWAKLAQEQQDPF